MHGEFCPGARTRSLSNICRLTHKQILNSLCRCESHCVCLVQTNSRALTVIKIDLFKNSTYGNLIYAFTSTNWHSTFQFSAFGKTHYYRLFSVCGCVYRYIYQNGIKNEWIDSVFRKNLSLHVFAGFLFFFLFPRFVAELISSVL